MSSALALHAPVLTTRVGESSSTLVQNSTVGSGGGMYTDWTAESVALNVPESNAVFGVGGGTVTLIVGVTAYVLTGILSSRTRNLRGSPLARFADTSLSVYTSSV